MLVRCCALDLWFCCVVGLLVCRFVVVLSWCVVVVLCSYVVVVVLCCRGGVLHWRVIVLVGCSAVGLVCCGVAGLVCYC